MTVPTLNWIRKASFSITALVAVSSMQMAQAATTSSFRAAQLASDGFRSKADRDNYFTINRVQIFETPESIERNELVQTADYSRFQAVTAPPIPPIDGGLGPVIGGIIENAGGLITLGLKIWDIVVANKPKADVSSNRVSVLPNKQEDWARLDSWQQPTAHTYTLKATNLFGIDVVTHTYTVTYNYGGRLNGVGHYLSNATIIASKVSVSWGYSLNSKVEIGDTMNVGTSQDPIPGLSVNLNWGIDTAVKHTQGVESYFIRGDGPISRVN